MWAQWVSPYDLLHNRHLDTYGPKCKSGWRNPYGNQYLGPTRGPSKAQKDTIWLQGPGMPMNCILLYIIWKKSIFQTKSNLQIACSAKSVSGSAHQKFGPSCWTLWFASKSVCGHIMGLNVNLAKETQTGINIYGPLGALDRPKRILFASRAQEWRRIVCCCISSERAQFSKQNPIIRLPVVLIVSQVMPIKNLGPMGEPLRFASKSACGHIWA